MGVTAEQVEAGQAVYTKSTLRAYDFVVLIISNQLIWKCPSRRIEEQCFEQLVESERELYKLLTIRVIENDAMLAEFRESRG